MNINELIKVFVGINVLINCGCGCGGTEMVYEGMHFLKEENCCLYGNPKWNLLSKLGCSYLVNPQGD